MLNLLKSAIYKSVDACIGLSLGMANGIIKAEVKK